MKLLAIIRKTEKLYIMIKNKKLRYQCWVCEIRFISWQQRNIHEKKSHNG